MPTNGKNSELILYRGIREMFEAKNVQERVSDVLPSVLPMDKLIRIGLSVIRQNMMICKCSRESILACLFGSAQLGLHPDPYLGLVYWVPFWSTKLNSYELTIIPGWRGYIELGRRSGYIVKVSAEVVFEKDEFHVQMGLNERLDHIPFDGDDRGGMKGAYTVWTHHEGVKSWSWMPRADILKIKEKTKSRDKSGKIVGPWATDEPAMWRKTPIRHHAKFEALSPEDNRPDSIQTLATIDGAIEHKPETQRDYFLEDKKPLEIKERNTAELFNETFFDLIEDDNKNFNKFIADCAHHAGASIDDIEKSALEMEAEFRLQFKNWLKSRSEAQNLTQGKKTGKDKPEAKKSSKKTSGKARGQKKDEIADGNSKVSVFDELMEWQERFPDVYKKHIEATGLNPSKPQEAEELLDLIRNDPDIGPPEE